MRRSDIKGAAAILQAGGLIIYQTETFCAIGCLGANLAGNAEICRLKGRQPGKPLPVIAASLAQAASAARLEAAPQSLLARFWPGPLSLLLPAKSGIAPQLMDNYGKICLRVTSFTPAAALAQAAGGILSASSANFAGRPPAQTCGELDPRFLAACADSGRPAAILACEAPGHAATLPSTIAEPIKTETGWRLKILRSGAVQAQDLEQIWK